MILKPQAEAATVSESPTRGPIDRHNYLIRTLKPAAERAGIEGVNFQSLRRTSGTLFGQSA